MTTRFGLVVAALLACGVPAFAEDALTIAKDHDHAFDKATWRGGCNVERALALYEDKAIAVYPGEGEVADGKAGIKKLVEAFLVPFCGPNHKPSSLDKDDIRAIPIGSDHIMIIRTADVVDADGTRTHFRATELIHKSGEQWRYVVDHASIGVPPSTGETQQPTAK